MGMNSADPAQQPQPGHALAAELARSQSAAIATLPVLRHLLASDGPSLVSEAVVARVRGMLRDLAAQLYAGGRGALAVSDQAAPQLDPLVAGLSAHAPLLAHIHTLALESQLAERFEQRLSLDPVLSPLLQELIASDDQAVAELAMNTLAAQTRFMQSQRRMELPLEELPADLFHAALHIGEGLAHPRSAPGRSALMAAYDEGATRLSLLERLIVAMRRAVVACLAFDRAGLALFAQGLSALSGMARADAIHACHEQQAPRLALGLRAAGFDLPAIERQMLLIAVPGPWLADIAAITPLEARARLAERGGLAVEPAR
jgi:hypothetical protein